MAGVIVLNNVNEVQYDTYGNSISSRDGYLFSSAQSGLMVSGTDGTNTHILRTNSSGQLLFTGPGTSGIPSGGVLSTQIPDLSITGNITTASSFANIPLGTTNSTSVASTAQVVLSLNGVGVAAISITGTWTGTLYFDATVDGTNWGSINAELGESGNVYYYTNVTNSFYRLNVSGFKQVRVRGGTGTTFSPSAIITINASTGSTMTELSTQLVTGTNIIGGTFIAGDQSISSYPDPQNDTTQDNVSNVTIDNFGNLQVRGPVLTDEGSLRDDFTGTSLTTTLTGTLAFTNGSTIVNGTGTAFTSQIATNQYIKKSTDSETLYLQVASINSDTQLFLVSNYAGTTATGTTGIVSNWQTVTPSGGSIAVASSIATITCGTTANATGSLRALGDFLPYSLSLYASVSQRIANQTLYMGFQDVVGTANQQAIIQFTGTTNTQVNFITSFANTVADTQTTLVNLPGGGVTSTYHLYKIDLSSNQATLSIDGIVVAVNNIHLPAPYTDLFIDFGFINGGTAPASSTTFNVDFAFFENIDRVQIDNDFSGEPINVGGIDNTATGTLNALNASVYISSAGYQSIGMQLAAGTLIGTIIPQVSIDGGQTWNNTLFDDPNTSIKSSSIVFATANTATAKTIIGVGGAGLFRVSVSAYTSGTATVLLRASQIRDPSVLFTGQAGNAVPSDIALVGGTDGTNLRGFLTDTSGRQVIQGAGTAGTPTAGVLTVQGATGTTPLSITPTDGTKTTYSASAAITPGLLPTDIFTLTGSATKTIRILRVELAVSGTATIDFNAQFIKRSTANAGGTSTSVTTIPYDSNNTAATATVLAYTANPTTLGTSVGAIRTTKIFAAQSNTPTTQPYVYIEDFGNRPGQAVVLRGTTQVFAINFNGITITGGSATCSIEWTEE